MDDTKNLDNKTESKTVLTGIEKRNANLRPIKKFSECTPEELEKQKAIIEKSKQGTKAYHEKKRTLKESAIALLETNLTKDQVKKMLGSENTDLIKDGMTVQDVLLLSAFKEVLSGNVKGMEFLRDTSGFKQAVEITADITTESDRSLLEKVANRLQTG